MKVCLVIIFNHRYEENLNTLRDIYADKFSLIRFLMPFYNGNDPDVIPVYESSYQFHGFLAQGREKLLELDCELYFFISDDLILNPRINENNFMSELSLNPGDSFISGLFPLQKSPWNITRIYENIQLFYDIHTLFQKELVSREEATELFKAKGYDDFRLSWSELNKKNDKIDFIKKYGLIGMLRLYRKREMPFPMFGGYSDWFILPKKDFEIVSMKLGVMAAMGMFVEIAIPTAFMIYCQNVRFIDSTPYEDGSIWSEKEIHELEDTYNCNLKELLHGFPREKLYIHPVKLSKWSH